MIKLTCPECTSDEIYKFEDRWDLFQCDFCGTTFDINEADLEQED